MNAEISAVWDKIQGMINGFIVLLPNIVLALIVFAIFFFVARVAPEKVDEDFEEALRDIHIELKDLNQEAVELAAEIAKNFEELGI